NADFASANLTNVNFKYANLQDAFLGKANLQNADLHYVNLQNAYLLDAINLTAEQLKESATLYQTILAPFLKKELAENYPVDYERLMKKPELEK
ncbi:MAG: pentapeptide repeat-containing protein, partial [Nitrospirae bacterium]|nr:pentapeptide repeat-containing protein [Nitrospirota bacterium]